MRSRALVHRPVLRLRRRRRDLTALHYRRRTGKGQYIDLSEQEAAIPIMGAALLEYQMTGRVPERMGDRSAWAAPQGCYRCAGDDRWAVISCADDAEFARMANAMGHAEWLDDPRFATVLARREHHDALDEAHHAVDVAARPVRRHAHAAGGGREGGAVLDGKEALLDPHFTARGAVRHRRPADARQAA